MKHCGPCLSVKEGQGLFVRFADFTGHMREDIAFSRMKEYNTNIGEKRGNSEEKGMFG